MGKVVRVILCFRERFWQNLHGMHDSRSLGDLSFLFSRDNFFPTWWTQMPERVPILAGWAPAKSAERLAGLSKDAVIDQASRIFKQACCMSKNPKCNRNSPQPIFTTGIPIPSRRAPTAT